MEGHCSTGQSPQWAVVPLEEVEDEEEEEEEEEKEEDLPVSFFYFFQRILFYLLQC